MNFKIYFPELYIERNLFAVSKLEKLKRFNIEPTKKNKIGLSKLNFGNEEKWNFLDGLKLRGRSGKSIIFKKEITPKIAQLLGFIITDGSLPSTEGRVKLCQKDINLLKDYLDIINKEYRTDLNLSFNGKEANISSVPLRYVLNKYYFIPLGKKVRIVKVPYQIINSKNKDVLRNFIAGLFDGDGYIQYYYLKDKPILDHAHFCISTSSHNLIKQSVEILERLGINCSISKRSDGRLTLQTAGFINSLEFYKQIIPLIFHRQRKRLANKIFLGEDFAGKFTLPLNQELRELFKEVRNRKLGEELLNLKIKYKYIKSLRSIESWTYPSKYGKIRSIYVYKACKLLNKKPEDYMPKNQLNIIENRLK